MLLNLGSASNRAKPEGFYTILYANRSRYRTECRNFVLLLWITFCCFIFGLLWILCCIYSEVFRLSSSNHQETQGMWKVTGFYYIWNVCKLLQCKVLPKVVTRTQQVQKSLLAILWSSLWTTTYFRSPEHSTEIHFRWRSDFQPGTGSILHPKRNSINRWHHHDSNPHDAIP